MITVLAWLFVKESKNPGELREQYGILCGTAGILLNCLLFGVKLSAGLVSGSISIMADAINNLSDAGSSVVTLIGFKLAGQKPDSRHPYGHGRIEYIAAFIVASAILAMGFALMKESLMKILNPAKAEFSVLTLFILGVSIFVKLYMAYYNHKIGTKINSVTLLAVSKDSLGDSVATAMVLVSSVIAHFGGPDLDGYTGCLVSLFIFYAGFSAVREALDPLLGTPPDKAFLDHIKQIVLEFNPENIVGYHDLLVHDYGPGRKVISLHAEVPADGDMRLLHDLIDQLEKRLNAELGCLSTIHMDPIEVDDPEVGALKESVQQILQSIDDRITIHDFRVVWGETHNGVIFDMVLPYDCALSDKAAVERAFQLIQNRLGEKYLSVIEVDHAMYG